MADEGWEDLCHFFSFVGGGGECTGSVVLGPGASDSRCCGKYKLEGNGKVRSMWRGGGGGEEVVR